jgi:DNA replication and repair protein RecF
MIVKSLKLRNFRNYEDETVYLAPGMNLITGKNAQGKTNLLESLVYLSLTRSHRIANDKALIRKGFPFAHILCEFTDEKRDMVIEAVIHESGKTLRVQKQPVKKSSEFIGLLNVVLFAPDDLRIFTDAPMERRKVINQEITKVSSVYFQALSRYQALLKERNLLLKREQVDLRFLATLEEQMISCQSIIIKMRKDFVECIDQEIGDAFKKLSGQEIDVHVKYHCCIKDFDQIETALQNMYSEKRELDLKNQVTSAGIQKEDMKFELNGMNVIETASQGQKRILMMSFKLALLAYIQGQTNKKPVLLLDDVLSELDYERQKRLLDLVKGPCQCLITSTDIPDFLKEKGMKEMVIENGSVKNGGQLDE